jgi:glutamine amidotransferase-like uncharacterized protein
MREAPQNFVLAWLSAVALCVAACAPAETPSAQPQARSNILLFIGEGTSRNDVAAIEHVLRRGRFDYSTADSTQLNAMNEDELGAHRLLIVPGGNFERIGRGLDPETTAHIRNAVRGGMNYLGLCAGAFFAGASPYNGLNLTEGVRFNFYALEHQGVRRSAVPITIMGFSASDHYWEDGPELSGWGDVVARYSDGSPAIVEGSAGRGWLILTGIHPEAPESWRRGLTFRTSAAANNAYAATLIDAAMNGVRLPHY